MKLNPALSWMKEIVLDPLHIQKLVDKRGFDEWSRNQSREKKIDLEKESTDHFSLTDKRHVRELMKKLPGLTQSIIFLRFWENLTTREIARVLGATETKVIKILEEGIKELRTLFDLEKLMSQTAQNAPRGKLSKA